MGNAFLSFWRRHELLRDSVQTILICYIIALVIWFTDAGGFWLTLQVSLVFGVSCLCAIRVSLHYLRDKTSILIATVIGYSIGVIIGTLHLLYQMYDSFEQVRNAPASDLILKILFSLLVTYIFYNSHRVTRKQRELQAQREQSLRQEKELAESNYQILQSQIEPHFLFNTLANIRVLIDVEPQQAKKVLDNLTGLLRVSMTKAERQVIPLEEELQLVESYLAIQQVRMGSRLTFDIRVQGDTSLASCPPFTLQPLVENAVIHGIEPTLGGGDVIITVTVTQDRCQVIISDTGPGLAHNYQSLPPKGHGIAVKNIHQRLALLYQEQAQLELVNQTDSNGQITGCIATLSWPVAPHPEIKT